MSTVIAQSYSTTGNGGRKLVRLSNGWQVAGVIDRTASTHYYRLYIDKQDGQGFKPLLSKNFSTIQDITLVAIGQDVGVLIGRDDIFIDFHLVDASIGNTKTLKTIDSSQTAIGNVSLAIDPINGHLHAAWASKNLTYRNSFNIRYAKSTDGGLAWSAVEQRTTANTSGYDNSNPSIIVKRNGKVGVFFQQKDTENRLSYIYQNDSGAWTSGGGVYNGGSYPQTNPSAVVDKDGVIHVAWLDSMPNNIRYSKSVDGGITWNNEVVSMGHGYPSITVDKTGKVVILYHRTYTSPATQVDLFLATKEVSGWTVKNLTDTPTFMYTEDSPSTLYDATFAGVFSSIPPTIYMKSTTGTSVEYIGTYTTNQEPILNLNTANNQTLSETAGQNEILVEGSTLDTNANDTVTVKLQINDGTIRNIASAISNGSAAIPFSRLLTYKDQVIYDGATPISIVLAEDVDHKLKVWSEDSQGGKSTIAEQTFRVVHNRPPVITDTDRDLGTLIQSPSVTYQVNDLEGHEITVTEKVNGQVIRSFAAVSNMDYTLEIPLEKWILLHLASHTLTIEATDSAGLTSTRTYTFTRIEDTIQLELKNPFETDVAATRVLVTPEVYVPIGASILIEACNNAFDEAPAWEDVTSIAMANRGYNFVNTTKTAAQWGINIRFTLEKGTATQEVRLDGFGGAFD